MPCDAAAPTAAEVDLLQQVLAGTAEGEVDDGQQFEARVFAAEALLLSTLKCILMSACMRMSACSHMNDASASP